jgi:hypothetical protein
MPVNQLSADRNISPCRIVPCLEKLKDLQNLTLVGGYWMWDSKDEHGEKWDTLEEYLWHYIEKASLKQPAATRVAGSLRSRKCTDFA